METRIKYIKKNNAWYYAVQVKKWIFWKTLKLCSTWLAVEEFFNEIICNMRRFKYRQIDHMNYPSEEDLNKLGEMGWELVCIETFEKRFFDDELENSYTRKIYKATFKKEILNS